VSKRDNLDDIDKMSHQAIKNGRINQWKKDENIRLLLVMASKGIDGVDL
jgi:hypothetical protein